MTTKNEGASGKITLYDRFEESASGHIDITQSADLSIDGEGRVVLTVTDRRNNFYKMAAPIGGTQTYPITVERLIALITGESVSL